ncbi:uncharacterized protein LOC133180481 [Saccostrea echinata]|uniref:uncharacterized protein LOC133180481 n=1 Tax=Saccostrea echinata TaxID=191078 RepID=UPI002A826C42|nr:uncharacterized protein LOC133180481 [Saccostrea echinata]
MGDAPSPSVLYFDPKKSTENFARLCQLLVTICGDVMRDILSHYIKPVNFRQELDKNRSKLEKITNAQEKDLLYPPHSSSSCVPQIRSRDLDLSLLYKILRNICNIPTHIAGWGKQPRVGDFSLASCIERIRILRNSISGHSTDGAVDDVEFENYWRELKKSVVEIEREVIGSDKYERGIDHLYDCDLNPTKSKEYVAEIRRNTGEIKIKRERIDLVEEEANAKKVRLEILEQRQATLEKTNEQFKVYLKARLTEIAEDLRAVKSDTSVLKELKATELRLQQEECMANISGETITRDTSPYTLSKSTTTTIKFRSGLKIDRMLSMHCTSDNKCWLWAPNFSTFFLSKSAQLCLLSDIGVSKEIEIPEEYEAELFSTNITVNEDDEAVFISGTSLVAVGKTGVFRKLFNIYYPACNVCYLRSGNYLLKDKSSVTFSEYTKEGHCLKICDVPAITKSDLCQLSIYQNSNQDFIVTNDQFLFWKSKHLYIFNKSFESERTVEIEPNGIITPVFNKNGELLYGHYKSIDLLNSEGEFVDTIYKTRKRILNIAYSNNGTIWIQYTSFEIDIFKLELPHALF